MVDAECSLFQVQTWELCQTPTWTACGEVREGSPWSCHTSVRQSATFAGHGDPRAQPQVGREMPVGPL